MKFSTPVLTLCALYSADAFTVQAPAKAATKLQASQPFFLDTNGDTATRTAPPAPQQSQNVGSAVRNDSGPMMSKFNAPRPTKDVFEDTRSILVGGLFAWSAWRKSLSYRSFSRPERSAKRSVLVVEKCGQKR